MQRSRIFLFLILTSLSFANNNQFDWDDSYQNPGSTQKPKSKLIDPGSGNPVIPTPPAPNTGQNQSGNWLNPGGKPKQQGSGSLTPGGQGYTPFDQIQKRMRERQRAIMEHFDRMFSDPFFQSDPDPFFRNHPRGFQRQIPGAQGGGSGSPGQQGRSYQGQAPGFHQQPSRIPKRNRANSGKGGWIGQGSQNQGNWQQQPSQKGGQQPKSGQQSTRQNPRGSIFDQFFGGSSPYGNFSRNRGFSGGWGSAVGSSFKMEETRDELIVKFYASDPKNTQFKVQVQDQFLSVTEVRQSGGEQRADGSYQSYSSFSSSSQSTNLPTPVQPDFTQKLEGNQLVIRFKKR